MKLLVTGAGRCGTWWLTNALRACGVDARHEQAYSHKRHRAGSWPAEVSWLAAPFTPVEAYTVHLVRHPLRQIASRAAWGSFETAPPVGRYDPRPKGRWAMRQCPRITVGRTAVERAAIHWVDWNRLVSDADEVLRIEDVDGGTVRRLASIAGGSGPVALPARVNGSRNPPVLSWPDVAHIDGLVDLAGEYGYRRDE